MYDFSMMKPQNWETWWWAEACPSQETCDIFWMNGHIHMDIPRFIETISKSVVLNCLNGFSEDNDGLFAWPIDQQTVIWNKLGAVVWESVPLFHFHS